MGDNQEAYDAECAALAHALEIACAKEHDSRTSHDLFGHAGSHPADGIGRTRPRAEIRHPGATAHCGSAAG